MTSYDVTIGLEVHVELKTASKIFCSCSTAFGAPQNTNVCPICLGLPGVLPVLNKKVVEYAVKAGLALNCQIASFSKFDRKNYYYPDLPKNFQTSQYDLPIAANGYLEIETTDSIKKIGITRVHMEEDAGKLVHQGNDINTSQSSLVDLNRTGVPLIEIVSEPDISSAQETKAYLDKLKAILQYIDISDCKMEEGSLRCDVNISLRNKGTSQLGTKTEIKNMNSFKAVQKAIEYEIQRQTEILNQGGKIIQETRTWDEANEVTVGMRSKEQANDYRYFPEPDLVPMIIDSEWIAAIRAGLPELPDARKKRLVEEYGLPEYDAAVITSSRALSDYFNSVLLEHKEAKTVSNWVMGELMRLLNVNNLGIEDVKVTPKQMAELLDLLSKDMINGKTAKAVFEEMFSTGKSAGVIVKEQGLEQISDEGAINQIIRQVIAENPKSVEDYQEGKEQAIGFLVGQVMKITKGKANPGLVNKLLKENLKQD